MKNRFTKGFLGQRGGTFKCDGCGHLTRDTGENASVGLCPLCYEECTITNSHADGHITDEEYDKQMDALKKKYIKRDGKIPWEK